jgi:Winged helix-turn-helix domain (DUF2582)
MNCMKIVEEESARASDLEGGDSTAMQEQIGTIAGAIWHALEGRGKLTLPALKKEVQGKAPVFDWAIGWLAREDKIVISPDRRSFLVRLKETQARGAGAS